jgi:predicted nucleic acid-binding protein
MVLELAVAAGSRFIVTFNARDFAAAQSFGVRVVTPQEFLRAIGDIP